MDAVIRERRRLAAQVPAVIIGVVGLLAAAYVPLFIMVGDLGPQVFGFPGGDVLTSLAFAAMGFLIARSYPGNPLGWIMLAVAVLSVVLGDAQLYALLIYRAGYGNLPLGKLAAWLGSTLWGPALSLIPIGVLLFPDGHVRSRRWKVVLGACVVLDTVFVVALALFVLTTVLGAPVSIGLDGQVSALSGCVGCSTKGYGGFGDAFLASFPLLPLTLALAAAGLLTNTIDSQGERRQQMKWFMYAAALSAVGLAVYGVSQFVVGGGAATQAASAITLLGLAALPVGTAVAVFKYRLYDIDLVISRTLVYGSLAVFITVVYVGIAVGIGSLVAGGGKPNLALSILATGIVAVGFQPVRERVKRVANRLVYGNRATPYEVLSEFSERVAESYASDDVLPRMARVLADGTAAERAEVWLRSGVELRRAAAYPPLEMMYAASVHLNGTAELSIPTADRSVVVRHQGEMLGALTVTKRRGESLTPIEVKLMDDLAHQAGLVLKNVGLTADLQARLVDLRASRQRLVAAQDNERRKLERNLHDGAQQYLVAIKVKLGLVEMLLPRDPSRATTTLHELKNDADEALETLRDLARGIYPPLLADKGLLTAIEAQARKATLPVTVEAHRIGRYPQETEAALYFCVLEALQNIQKYGQATSARVRLGEEADQLCIEIADDGCGFDVSTTARGNGLTNMEDRLDALGGRLQIESTRGLGTTLRATVPALHPTVAATRP